MVASDKHFAGSIPEIYDRYLVPLIFEECARDLALRIARHPSSAVLETAAGTGVLTRAMAERLPPATRITATDLNQPMLDRAAARQPPGPEIAWRQADALALPFEADAFDVVACQFGAMFFPDRVQGYREVHRVLRRRGRFLFNVWDRLEANDFADVVTAALAQVFPADPPRFMARTPHGYHDASLIRADLAAAGFVDVAVERLDGVSRAASAHDVAIAYCQGTPLRNEIETRDASRLEPATMVVTEALQRRFGAGPIEGGIRWLVVNAG